MKKNKNSAPKSIGALDLKAKLKDLQDQKRGGEAPKQSEVVPKDNTPEDPVKPNEQETTKNRKTEENPDVEALKSLIKMINDKPYSNDSVVTIDKEAHELLSLMKRKLGIKQYSFLSYLIQNFYEENEGALKELLSDKNTEGRKFLNI